MKCWKCGKQAEAMCKFCGVALCKTCTKRDRYITGMAALGEEPKGDMIMHDIKYLDVIIVENAIWCGKCTINHAFDVRDFTRPEG